MSKLLSRASAPDSEGRIQHITPESAGWEYVGFDVYQLSAGQSLKQLTEDREVCVVLVTGFADVNTTHESWSGLGDRMSVFEQKAPYAVYVPPADYFEVR